MSTNRVILVDALGNVLTTGIASGAADSGNPVKVGGVYNTTLPTLSAAQRGDIQVSSRGMLWMTLATSGGSEMSIGATSADAVGAGALSAYAMANGHLLNNSTWDRARNNYELTLLASAARTATSTGSDQTNYNANLAYIVVDVTAGAAAPGITPAIQGKDSLSGKYIQLHANLTKITATGTVVYFFGLGTPAAAGGITAVSGFPLPRVWRLVVTADDTTSYTYSVGCNFIN